MAEYVNSFANFLFIFNLPIPHFCTRITLELFDNSPKETETETIRCSVLYQPRQHKAKPSAGINIPLSALRASIILLFSSISECWFHLLWQSYGSHRRRCYKCSVTTLNTAGSERLDSSRMQPGRRVTTACPAAACLTSAFISHFNYACKLLCASTFCWPSFDAGRG